MLPQSNERVTGALGEALCVIGLERINGNHKLSEKAGLCEEFQNFRGVHKFLRSQT